MLDAGPLSSVLGADGYIISLLEPNIKHVFVRVCLDSISIHYSVNMFHHITLFLPCFIASLLCLFFSSKYI